MTIFFRPVLLGFTILLTGSVCTAQKTDAAFNVKEVERIENFLASDEMRGRKSGSPEIDKAAAYIADEFKKAGLQPVKGTSFLQEFVMIRPKMKELKFKADGADVDGKNIVVVTSKPELEVDEKSGYEVRYVKAGGNFQSEVTKINGEKKNLLVLIDTSFTKNFTRLPGLKRQMF